MSQNKSLKLPPDSQTSDSHQLDFAIQRLLTWIAQNGWAGYDPYDVKDNFIYRLVHKTKYPRLAVERLFLLRFPRCARTLIRVQPQVNAKAMGLLAYSFVDLYEIEHDPDHKTRAEECLSWLEANKSHGYPGHCWGYPFNWYTLITIPKWTPSTVVTTVVAEAFYRAAEAFHDNRLSAVGEQTSDFYMKGLNRTELTKDELCFSYTPLDRFTVHNANLFTAKQLFNLGQRLELKPATDLAVKALNYTLNCQNPDGSWFYGGPPGTILTQIDHYHTGYVLRTLHDIYALHPDDKILKAIEAGLGFYLENMFEPDGAPGLYPGKRYPIDIHSCAEAILCLTTLQSRFPHCQETAAKTLAWTLANMQHETGCFYYRIYRKWADTFPYIRWAQAWMLRALSAVRKAEAIPNEPHAA